MPDSAQRFILEYADVRGELVHLEQSYQEIIQQHDYPPHVQAVLGEALLAAVLLTSTIKFEGELSLQFQGEGALKLLVVKCTDKLDVRAVAQWDEEASPEDFYDAFVSGKLVVTIQPKNNTRFYQSVVPLEHRCLAEAIESYFLQSEQLTTRLWFAVNSDHAAGMLLQLLPGIDTDERNDFWNEVVMLADTLKPNELIGWDNLLLLDRLYSEEDARIFAEISVQFKCSCTVERMERAILTLGEDEANTLLRLNKEVVVTCEFCNKTYAFDSVDVAHIFATRSGGTLH